MLGAALRRKSLTVSPLRDGLRLLGGGEYHTTAGVRVGPSTAMVASSVYAAVTLNADTLSSLPVRYVERGDESRTNVEPPVPALTGKRVNAYQTLAELVNTSMLAQDLWGEAFIMPRYSRGGDVLELWPIDPDRIVDHERIEDAQGFYGLRFRLADWNENGGWVENRPGQPVQMIHIPLHVLPGKIRGISPVAMQAELMGLSLSAQRHAARFLGRGVHMSGVIETDADLDNTGAKELVDNFNLIHAGPENAGGIGVMSGGATFKTITIPPNELQFLEQMKYADQKIATIYRVPPHLMGDVEKQTSWGTGVEEQTNNWVKFSLLNRAKKFEEAFEAALFADSKTQMRFMLNGLLRGVAKDRAEFYRILWSLGALSQDDIRALEDMGPLPDGKGSDYYVPLNTAPIGTMPDAQKARITSALELLAEGR